jgi:hypothetical protein
VSLFSHSQPVGSRGGAEISLYSFFALQGWTGLDSSQGLGQTAGCEGQKKKETSLFSSFWAFSFSYLALVGSL